MECWLIKWKKLSNLSNNSGQRSRKWLTIFTLWTQSPINWILTGTPIIVKGVVDCAVSESAALGRGEEYLKTKIHILKQEVEKDQFVSKAFTTESYLQDALKKLEGIDRKITEESTFEKLLRELFDFNRDEFNLHEEWKQIQLGIIIMVCILYT